MHDSSYDPVIKALSHVKLPEFKKVRYDVPLADAGFDARVQVRKTVLEQGLLDRIRPGEVVALSASSREIAQQSLILGTLVELLRDHGARPMIVAAMGSHGGATAEGQCALMESYGITEQTMGCPVRATMNVTLLGMTEKEGLPVYQEENAAAADHIIPVGRVKSHPDFRGKVESGLQKMLTIGFGKQHGASLCHQRGWARMSDTIQEVAGWILDHRSVPFGLAIIEDSMHKVAMVEAVPGEQIRMREPELLDIARSYIPKLPFEKVDVLFVDELGKDISGAGMDPNVTGRSAVLGSSAPFIDRIAVRDLTLKTKHNAAGIGNADVITRRLFDQIDLPATYVNVITSHDSKGGMLPPAMPSDLTAFQYAMESITGRDDPLGLRIVWIHSTAAMREFYISPALYAEAEANPALELSTRACEACFNEAGDFTGWNGEFTFWK